MAPEIRRGRAPLVLGAVVMAIAALAVIQVRSQADVDRSLASQDNTSIAFIIDDLHRANEALGAQSQALADRHDALLKGGTTAGVALSDEAAGLRVLEGLDPARGPGVTLVVDAPLNAIDLEDAVNNLRLAGAEAVSVGGRRVVTGSAIVQSGGAITIDGQAVRGPWQMAAIGSPASLSLTADEMTRTLRADPRVRQAVYASVADLTIAPVVRPRPYVYATAA